MSTKIEIRDGIQAGETGYLIRTFNQTTQKEYMHVQSMPGTKNLSGEACVDGWLGDTNNVSRHAMGQVKVLTVEQGEYMGDPSFGTVEAA